MNLTFWVHLFCILGHDVAFFRGPGSGHSYGFSWSRCIAEVWTHGSRDTHLGMGIVCVLATTRLFLASRLLTARGQTDHRNIMILLTILSGILLVLGLRAKMWDSYDDVVLGTPTAFPRLGGCEFSLSSMQEYQIIYNKSLTLILI